jgi:hypothetical protein
MTISICLGYVRIADAETWAQAQEFLRREICDSYPVYPAPGIAEWKERELSAAAAGPDPRGMLVTSRTGTGMAELRWAREGEHGLTAGDLAVIHDFRHRNRDIWTIDVKCRITAVTGRTHRADVQVTGESQQFTRHERITLPVTFLWPR